MVAYGFVAGLPLPLSGFTFRLWLSEGGVSLAGTFNGWNKTSHPMAGPDKDGYYSLKIELAAGAFEYKFVCNSGKLWAADPTNIRTVGKYENSLLVLGEQP